MFKIFHLSYLELSVLKELQTLGVKELFLFSSLHQKFSFSYRSEDPLLEIVVHGKNINLPVFDGIKGYLLWSLKNHEDVVEKNLNYDQETFILWGGAKTSDLELNINEHDRLIYHVDIDFHRNFFYFW